MPRNSVPSPSIATSARITTKKIFSLLQQTRCGEVATKNFWGVLCVAKSFQKVAEIQPDFLASAMGAEPTFFPRLPSSRLGTQFLAALLPGARSACRVDCSADLRRRSGSFAGGPFPSRSLGTRGQRRKKWQSTDWLPFWRFLGWTPKNSPVFAPLFRPLADQRNPSPPAPLPQAARGEGLTNKAGTHHS